MSSTGILSRLKSSASGPAMQQIIALAALVVLYGFFAIFGNHFLSADTFLSMLSSSYYIGFLAIGMTFVIISKGIDLSVGSIVAVAAVVATSLAQQSTATNLMYPGLDLPVIVAVLVGLLVGLGLGAVNGFLIAYTHIAPFIATLGMMTAARGLALIYSDGRPISRLKDGFNWIGQGDFLFVPVPIWLFAIVAVISTVLMNYTRFGRYVFALGGNEQAARVSGINISRILLLIYTFSGLLAGLAGMLLAARIGSGNPQLGTAIELDAITAAVIGGTSFNGGIGTVWGTIVGALIIGIINNGLDLMNVSPFMQQVVKGVIIVVAIIIDERKNR